MEETRIKLGLDFPLTWRLAGGHHHHHHHHHHDYRGDLDHQNDYNDVGANVIIQT